LRMICCRVFWKSPGSACTAEGWARWARGITGPCGMESVALDDSATGGGSGACALGLRRGDHSKTTPTTTNADTIIKMAMCRPPGSNTNGVGELPRMIDR